MKIFVTGATGFIGSAVVDELLRRNHTVIGLARSDKSAQKLADKDIEIVRGSLTDTDILTEGAKNSDGVIHLGFNNNFDDMAGAVEQDVNAVNALGNGLIGTNKPFVNTSGTLMVAYQGRPATEDDAGNDKELRSRSEKTALGFATKGVRATAVRLAPTVHDATRQGLATVASQIAIKNGAAAYFNGGTNEWPAVHRLDAAVLFVDALEKGQAGSAYNAVAETGIPFKDIATTISTTLGLPLKSLTSDDAIEYAGPFLSNTLQSNNPTSSDKTQRELNWHPTQPGLLADLQSFLSDSKNVEYLKNN
ncbi:SDR family oxidoreductase [Lentilactobacillus sp. SPB1-3]|uniref:SDR family oxidoreductase n=1 Tax=Lentilactobacillus terminaliae TaxID=3003483 RepID=A0ACD5DDH8_9LACO|nr:SDR family oxidoreductase [Lentilactobacillus sp. SPB1-3]MCZ0977745.1 SDR family oxidoreductase [Lentilactobacillus sp. SPB1-3]